MIIWQRRHTLIMGLALIVMTNAVALLGAAYNRSGSPESQLVLSQRELESPDRQRYGGEDSNFVLRLRWRVIQPDMDGQNVAWPSYYFGSPEWLDEKKLLELGIDLPQVDDNAKYRHKGLQKDVLLVLEMNGTTYQRALERARAYLAKEQAVLNVMPGSQEFARRFKAASEALAREESENSRLFVVDAGLDVSVLRARYLARDRYVIVHGRIYPAYSHSDRGQQDRWSGFIGDIDNDRISVPLKWRQVFESARDPGAVAADKGTAFEAVVAFGQRQEPWLVSAAASLRP